MVLLSLPVTDVGRVLAFFSCSLRSSLDPAVSGFFSSGWAVGLSRDPALLALLLPGCGLTLTWVGRESQEKNVFNPSTCQDSQSRARGFCWSAPSSAPKGAAGVPLGATCLQPWPRSRSGSVQTSQRGDATVLESCPVKLAVKAGSRERLISSQSPAPIQSFSYFSRNCRVHGLLLLMTLWILPNQVTLIA